MQCPKCEFLRPMDASNPDWQCPACGIAYHKYNKRHRVVAAFKPLTSSATSPSPAADTSTWTLMAINVVALAIAYIQGWSISELMLIYWAQSLIIGASYVGRIRALKNFSTSGFRINNKSVKPTEQTKKQTAFFFLIHFGFFHVVYLVFILQNTPLNLLYDAGFLLCTAGFAINHSFSYRYHRDLDAKGEPNIGTLMFTPYIRIIPMHLTIILGNLFGGGFAMLLFGSLKTVADGVMHVVEHRRLGHEKRPNLP